MGNIDDIAVHLVTGNAGNAGTDDVVYLGYFGTGGGREFPLIVPNFDDYAQGAAIDYHLGTDNLSISGSPNKKVQVSGPGSANDPARVPVELDTVQYVYLRKGGDGRVHTQTVAGASADQGDDDDWLLAAVEVVLSDGTGLRQFAARPAEPGLFLGNATGHFVYLKELKSDLGAKHAGPGHRAETE